MCQNQRGKVPGRMGLILIIFFAHMCAHRIIESAHVYIRLVMDAKYHNEKSLHGFPLDQLKFGLQKYVRRAK